MERHERLMLAVLNETSPTDEEWERWIELGAVRVGADVRCVIEVHGNVGPSARQRQALTPWLGKIDMRTAVLSNSLLVRGVVTAVSWLGVRNEAFDTGALEAAARYLGLTSEEQALAKTGLRKLRKTAGVRSKTGRVSARPGAR